jgi:hypothetical protein
VSQSLFFDGLKNNNNNKEKNAMKNSFFGLFAAALLLIAPQAFAGYWTGHHEVKNHSGFSTDPVNVFRDWIINQWLDHHGA